ncbi:hypothetical protein HU200_037589 [Digitaria exilis]|uniref:FLZ-type domain-containing protein n=1 Tax=Digitaria exilis TaxID=1010633 RepID=A0A835EK02_9POAL|nr:hypothetical protein HU200_037589 [Digitaria exilis]CAB3453458.1 unnamed protein product [Digitaria exilis]
MLPRPSQRSIFHLGEEGGCYDSDHRAAGDEHVKSATADTPRRQDHGRRQRPKRDAAVDDADAAGVGLQILVQHRHRSPEPPHSRSIVLKQVVVLPTAARHLHGRPCGSFLRACSLCRRELSPDKDVYMYRGDQGFCSEECRWQQMLNDEAREHEAMVKKERARRGLPPHRHHAARPAICGAPGRQVAVAY